MAKIKVNYEKIYEFLEERRGHAITASMIAYAIGVETIYGGTMTKLVRDGYLEKSPAKGFYKVK